MVTAVTSASPVIRFASQPSPSRARVPTRIWQWPSWKYVVISPTHCRGSQGPRICWRVEPAPSGSTRSRPARSRSGSQSRNPCSVAAAPATVLPVTSIGLSPLVSGAATRASSIECAEPACWSMTPVRSAGRVAPARSWSQRTSIRIRSREVEVLVGADLDDGGGLRRRPGQHPVDRAAAAADAALGPLVADRRQRAAYRLHDLLVLGQPGLGEPAGQPVVDQQHPVVRGRCRAVLLLHPGAARQPDHPDVVQPQHGPAHVRLLLDQREPRRPAGHEPRVEPLQERHRAERRVGELGDQLPEPLGLLLQPVVLARASGWSARRARRTAPGRRP